MQHALDEVAAFFERQEIPYTRYDDSVVWQGKDAEDFPVVFTEGKYSGWAVATFSFAHDGPRGIEGLRSFRRAAKEKFGGRLEVICEGREFYIVGLLKSDPTRFQDELEDFVIGCKYLSQLIASALEHGKWLPEWNTLAFGETLGRPNLPN